MISYFPLAEILPINCWMCIPLGSFSDGVKMKVANGETYGNEPVVFASTTTAVRRQMARRLCKIMDMSGARDFAWPSVSLAK